MITADSLETMTDFAKSGLTAVDWMRGNRTRFCRDVVAPMQLIMTEVERTWGDDFQAEFCRPHTAAGVRLHRDRMYLGAVCRTPAWRHAATAAWVPNGFSRSPQSVPRIELRLGYGYWEMGFALGKSGLPWMTPMVANLLPHRALLERLLNPLMGGHRFHWGSRDIQRDVTPDGHGIYEIWEPYDADQFFDGITAWDRPISATDATAWDLLPTTEIQTLAELIVTMVRRVYPLMLLTLAVDSETAVRAIENYLNMLAKEHPTLLSVTRPKPDKIIQFPGTSR